MESESLDGIEKMKKCIDSLQVYVQKRAIKSARIIATEADYYQKQLQERSKILGSSGPEYLCKALVMQNKAHNDDLVGPYYPKFLCVITQYVAKFSTGKLEKYIRQRHNAAVQAKASKKMFHYRLTKPETAFELTGYQRNEVCPLMLNCKMPIVMARSIPQLPTGSFYMGAGHLQVKLHISVDQFKEHCENQFLVCDLSQ